MARQINRLAARFVEALLSRLNQGKLRQGDLRRHADGGGLYLSVSKNGGARWLFIYRWGDKQPEIGLGSARDVPLGAARIKALAMREQLASGINPKNAIEKGAATFGDAMRDLIGSMEPSWRNAKHRYQWHQTLLGECPPDADGSVKKTKVDYCATIRDKPAAELGVEDALKVLQPLWQARAETASRLRGRLERVWDFARARGHCDGRNPFAWKGNLAALLPKRQKLARGHHPAMPYAEVPAFVVSLRLRDATAAKALEFTILTAARSGETLGAVWSEIDLDQALWTVPAKRMKAGMEHRVPLPPRAVEMLRRMRAASPGDHLFPGTRPGRPLSDMSMEMLLRRMKVEDATVHGFRSAFRDWAGDCTPFDRDVAEAALAHQVGNEVERAYRRGDALAKRRKLMEAWAEYCNAPTKDNVVPLYAAALVS